MLTWLLQHVAVTALLAVFVAVLSRLGRFRPAVCHALWVLVLIKLLVPPVPILPWSPADAVGLYRTLTGTARPAASGASPMAKDAVPAAPARLLRLIATVMPEDTARLGRHQPQWQNPARAVLLVLWLAGTLAMACLQAARLRRFLGLLRQAHPAPPWLTAQVEELAQTFNLTPPEALAVPRIWSAFTWPVGRPRLLIPEATLCDIEPERWRGVLAHELAHLKRRDHWVGWLELLAGCLWWWNPVFWYARRQLHVQAEMACDAWVVWALPERRRDYAEALVRIVELVSERPAPAPVLGMGSGAAVAFERRLVMILREHVPRRMPVVAMALILLLGAMVVPGWSQESSDAAASPGKPEAASRDASTAATDAEPPKEKSQIAKILDLPVWIEFEDVHISEILEFLADSYDLNIVLDQRAVAPEPRNVPPSPTADDAPAALPADAPSAEESASGPDESAGLQGRYVTDGMVPYIHLQDVAMREGLTALTRPLNLTFMELSGVVWVSSPALIETDAALPAPAARPASPEVAARLDSPIRGRK